MDRRSVRPPGRVAGTRRYSFCGVASWVRRSAAALRCSVSMAIHGEGWPHIAGGGCVPGGAACDLADVAAAGDCLHAPGRRHHRPRIETLRRDRFGRTGASRSHEYSREAPARAMAGRYSRALEPELFEQGSRSTVALYTAAE